MLSIMENKPQISFEIIIELCNIFVHVVYFTPVITDGGFTLYAICVEAESPMPLQVL